MPSFPLKIFQGEMRYTWMSTSLQVSFTGVTSAAQFLHRMPSAKSNQMAPILEMLSQMGLDAMGSVALQLTG